MARLLILMLLCAFWITAAADDPFLTRGLGARFIIIPSSERPQFYVRVELTNNGVEGSAGTIPNPVRLRLMPLDLHLRVVDEAGHQLPRSMRTEDQLIAPWNVEIPAGGRIDFSIGEGGDAPYKFSSGGPGQLLTFGLGNEWVIPPDGKAYYLVGALHEDRPDRFRNSRIDGIQEWTGSIDIPKIRLP